MYLHTLVCTILLLYASTISAFEHQSFKYEIGHIGYPETPIGKGALVFEDGANEHTIESIRQANLKWKQSLQDVFNHGYSASDWWLKFDIVNIGKARQFLIQIDYPVLDYLDVYIERNNIISDSFIMGDKLAFKRRPIQHRSFIVPTHIDSQEAVSVYLRIRSTSSIQAPIKIWNAQTFQESEISTNVIQGIYFGGMLIIGIYNLLLFVALRDRSYLYYVGYVFSMLLFLASLNGWSYQFLWPYGTQWNDISILFFLNGVVFFGIIFARNFLELKYLGKSINIQAYIWIVSSCIGFFVYFNLPYSVAIKFLVPYSALACIWALSAGVYAWHMGQRSASIYVLSWAGILIGGILLALNKTEFIPRNAITDLSVQLGSLLEAMLLSFALAQRISDERVKRFRAQEKANQELEANVTARTHELKEANQRLQQLSNTDQLTQLKNRRYLDQHIAAELVRAKRYQHSLSVMIVDIDHFKSVNDSYGHQVGDVCLIEVAKRFSGQLRNPMDLCARYGGEEFCIMLPETNREGALVVAERIRECICETNIHVKNLSLQITVSIGVYTKMPNHTESASDYLECADKALYTAKQNGRNRVEMFVSRAR